MNFTSNLNLKWIKSMAMKFVRKLMIVILEFIILILVEMKASELASNSKSHSSLPSSLPHTSKLDNFLIYGLFHKCIVPKIARYSRPSQVKIQSRAS
jgi:hypothetical protein